MLTASVPTSHFTCWHPQLYLAAFPVHSVGGQCWGTNSPSCRGSPVDDTPSLVPAIPSSHPNLGFPGCLPGNLLVTAAPSQPGCDAPSQRGWSERSGQCCWVRWRRPHPLPPVASAAPCLGVPVGCREPGMATGCECPLLPLQLPQEELLRLRTCSSGAAGPAPQQGEVLLGFSFWGPAQGLW